MEGKVDKDYEAGGKGSDGAVELFIKHRGVLAMVKLVDIIGQTFVNYFSLFGSHFRCVLSIFVFTH